MSAVVKLPQQAAEPQRKLLRHGAAPPPQVPSRRATTRHGPM